MEDIAQGHLQEADHGSWDGRWPGLDLLQGSFEAMQTLGWKWPSGGCEEFDVLTTAAHGKEFRWADMDEEMRDKYRAAGEDQWSKWIDNQAVEILGLDG